MGQLNLISSQERPQRLGRSHMAPGSVTAYRIATGCQKQPGPLGPNTQVLAQDRGHCDSVTEHMLDTHKFLVQDLHEKTKVVPNELPHGGRSSSSRARASPAQSLLTH